MRPRSDTIVVLLSSSFPSEAKPQSFGCGARSELVGSVWYALTHWESVSPLPCLLVIRIAIWAQVSPFAFSVGFLILPSLARALAMAYFRSAFDALPEEWRDFMKSNDLDSSVVLANLLEDEVPEFVEAPRPVLAIIEFAKALEFRDQRRAELALEPVVVPKRTISDVTVVSTLHKRPLKLPKKMPEVTPRSSLEVSDDLKPNAKEIERSTKRHAEELWRLFCNLGKLGSIWTDDMEDPDFLSQAR